MSLKTAIELITLSSSLYALSKDEQLMEEVQKLSKKGKESLEKLLKEIPTEEYDEYEISNHGPAGEILQRAIKLKHELDAKVEEMVEQAYQKMHIAHTKEIASLNEKINEMQARIDDQESRLSSLETNFSK